MSDSTKALLDYKARTIDPISDSFCAAKWYSAHIWLYQGRTASCHHPGNHPIPLDEIRDNPTAIHNTKFKKEQRRLMLEGVRPEECEYCWKIEDLGPDVVSDRVFKTIIYKESDVQLLQYLPWDHNSQLKRLEIAFDRTCNFACSYCMPAFSSLWGNDIKQNGPYKGLTTGGTKNFTNDGSHVEVFGKDLAANPYVEAFWKWWPTLKETLDEFRITGGEPTMSPHFWTLMERIRDEGLRDDLLFSINTNLGMKKEIMDRLIAASWWVPQMEIYTSCDTYGAHAEYLRDGLDYETWKANLVRLRQEGNIKRTHIMMTITGLSLCEMPRFLDDLATLKEKDENGHYYPHISVNILRSPTIMSPVILPDHLLQGYQSELLRWVEANSNEKWSKAEISSVLRLAKYIGGVDQPSYDPIPKEKVQADLKRFLTQYDQRRGKSFHDAFRDQPALLEWYDSVDPSL